jgi:hypothetical protein
VADSAWTLAYTPRTEEQFPEDSIKEVKQLIYTMVFGMKTVAWCISNFRPSKSQRSMVMDEVRSATPCDAILCST